MISNIQAANLKKSFRGLILTFSNGLLASSVLVFFLVKKGFDAGIELHHLLLILPVMTIFLWIRTFMLMPRYFIPFDVPRGFHYGYKEMKCFNSLYSANNAFNEFFPNFHFESSHQILEQQQQSRQDCLPQMHKSFLSCLKSTLLWTNIFHLSVVALRLAFTYGILQQWMEIFASQEQISKLTDHFGLIITFGALFSPINGIMFDTVVKWLIKKTGNSKLANLKATIITMTATSMFAFLLSLTMVLFNPYGTFIFMSLTKSFVFGGSAAFLAVNFPAQHIGKLVGLAFIIAGAVTVLQYPLLQLAFAFDPTF